MRKTLGTTERSRAKEAARLSMVSRSFEAISMGSTSLEKRDLARPATSSTPLPNLSRNPMFLTSQDDRLLRGYGAIGPIVTGVTRRVGRRSRWIGRVTGLTGLWIGLIGRGRP